MKKIKFRQRISNARGNDLGWHYWGFVDGHFVGPILSSSEDVDNSEAGSFQFIGRLDRDGNELYNGSKIEVYNWGIDTQDELLGTTTVVWDDEHGWVEEDGITEDVYDMFRNVKVIEEE